MHFGTSLATIATISKLSSLSLLITELCTSSPHHPPDHQVCRETGARERVGGERSTEEMVPYKVERILKKESVLLYFYFDGSIDNTPTVLHMN